MRKAIAAVLLLCAITAFGAQPSPKWKEAVERARELRAIEATRFSRMQELMAQSGVQRKQSVDQQHVDLNLRIDPQMRTIRGTVSIQFIPTATISKLKLRLRKSLTVSATTLDQTSIPLDRKGSDLIFRLNPALTTGSLHTITVTYSGTPRGTLNISSGMFFDTHMGVPSATTLSEPFGSYNWWPCIDDLSDKFTADISLTVPPGMLGASNGRLVDTTNGSDQWTTYHWQESYPIANYLISANVTNYVSFSARYRSRDRKRIMPIRYYVYPEDLQQAMVNFQNVPRMIRTFAKLVGEYPFVKEKYGMVAFPWDGGMEHQTLTSIADGAAGNPGNHDLLFAHELAHQWFGDDVTCATWNDIWLNEGFGTYFESLWGIQESGQSEGIFLSQFYDDGLYAGALKGSVYISNGSTPFADIGAIYDKGAWVLYMLKYVMGPRRFYRAIRNYRASHSYSNASTADLIAACEQVYGKSLVWFFDQWVYTPYRPIYRVSFAQSGRSLSVKVRQVQSHRINNRTAKAKVYIMPVELKTYFKDGSSRRFTVWNDQRAQTFTFEVSKTAISVTLDENYHILKVVQ